MVPTLEGEFARKRRMMAGLWDIVLGDGMLSPRGYGPLYAFEIASHRLLRYVTPFLHLVALGTNLALLGRGWVYTVTLALQVALPRRGAARPLVPLAPLRIAHYYVMVTASIAAGLWDRVRRGPPGDLGEGRGDAVSRRALRSARRRDRGAGAARPLAAARCVAAIAIRLDSRGPVIYRQRRVGLDGARVRDAQAADDGARLRPGRGRDRRSPGTTRA